jgi:hypothetical protein
MLAERTQSWGVASCRRSRLKVIAIQNKRMQVACWQNEPNLGRSDLHHDKAVWATAKRSGAPRGIIVIWLEEF